MMYLCKFKLMTVLLQLQAVTTNEIFASFKYRHELFDLMDKSGCDFAMEVFLN